MNKQMEDDPKMNPSHILSNLILSLYFSDPINLEIHKIHRNNFSLLMKVTTPAAVKVPLGRTDFSVLSWHIVIQITPPKRNHYINLHHLVDTHLINIMKQWEKRKFINCALCECFGYVLELKEPNVLVLHYKYRRLL